MGKYPQTYGNKMAGVLPDMATPLNINAEAQDPVPSNDMGAIPWSDGKGPKDPMAFVTPIEGGKK